MFLLPCLRYVKPGRRPISLGPSMHLTCFKQSEQGDWSGMQSFIGYFSYCILPEFS
jgi:hypothetical protein